MTDRWPGTRAVNKASLRNREVRTQEEWGRCWSEEAISVKSLFFCLRGFTSAPLNGGILWCRCCSGVAAFTNFTKQGRVANSQPTVPVIPSKIILQNPNYANSTPKSLRVIMSNSNNRTWYTTEDDGSKDIHLALVTCFVSPIKISKVQSNTS